VIYEEVIGSDQERLLMDEEGKLMSEEEYTQRLIWDEEDSGCRQ
jgi:hypothetical protein